MRVVIGTSSFAESGSAEPLKLLKEHNIQVIMNPYKRKMTEEEIIELIQNADGLLAGLEPLNEKVLAMAPCLKAIARVGVGMDNIDLDAAERRNIRISNTPEGPTKAVAEMTIAACLTLAHRIIPSSEDMHRGIWKKRMGISVAGTTVLIIGYGSIGKTVAEYFKVLGARVLVYDKYNNSSTTVTLINGVEQADIISIHASGNEEIIGENEFRRLKNGALLLNSARGKMVNEDALYRWLKNNSNACYWGDAHWSEPYRGKIIECVNAILTPHISTYTAACRNSMELMAVKNLIRDLKR